MKKLLAAVSVLAVSTAQADPGACHDPAAGDCCSANGTPGCNDAHCCQAVCAFDPFCCDVQWDVGCAQWACDVCVGTCVCVRCSKPLECPPGALIEAEPCGDDVNGGCGSIPAIFIDAACGDTFCGTAWAALSKRDTDWYLIQHPGGTLTATLTSMFDGTCFILDGIATCNPFPVGDVGCSKDSVALVPASANLPPGQYGIWVAATHCAGSGLPHGFPCFSDCNDYVLEIVCGCTWDCGGDNDGDVGIVDFLALLAQWGSPGSCDFDGGGVGIVDFLALLANWGPCP